MKLITSIFFLFLFSFSLVSGLDFDDYTLTQNKSFSFQGLLHVDFNNAGTKLYFTLGQNQGSINRSILEYNLSDSFDVSNATFNRQINFTGYNNTFASEISADGNYLITVGEFAFMPIYFNRYTLDVNDQASSFNQSSLISFSLTQGGANIDRGLWIRDSGNDLFHVGGNGASLFRWGMSNFNVSTMVVSETLPTTNQWDISFAEGGTELFTLNADTSDATIIKYNLNVPYQLATVTLTEVYDIDTNATAIPTSIYITDDEEEIFILYFGEGGVSFINQYSESASSTPPSSGGGGGSFADFINTFTNFFPDADDISLTTQLGYVFIVIIFLTGILLTVIYMMTKEVHKSAMYIVALIDMIAVFYFISISYIPITFLIVLVILVVAGILFLRRGGGD